ncbi:MAG: regulator [Fluviicola sp.]|nr:MAG: regulator [Fluviicola sp.]
MGNKSFLIFVVEDNEWYNKLLVHSLSLNPDFEIQTFFNGKDLLNALHQKPDVITLDYRLPDINGGEILKKIKSFNENIEVLIISEQDDIETAVDLLKTGAYDYFVKSKDIKEKLINTVSHIKKNAHLKTRINSLQKEVQGKYTFEKSIIGDSPALKKVFELMNKAVQTNINVTISGETGTGKEVVSKAIHYNSPRKDNPFVAINMAAIPSELIESELFGHEKGAFTGAATRRIGKFEEAKGGTLFLDEIGEMDMNFQAKLLRVLQEKEITRVGGNKVINIDCRIIIATNRNLQEDVKNGKFREDLYYRLIGLPIHLPALRERGQDILLLAKFFIDNFCKDNKLNTKTISENARKKLLNYHWPGNIRELKSIVELAAVMSPDHEITAESITLATTNALSDILTEELTLREYNRRIVNLYMEQYNSDTKLVADKLNIGQTTVYRLLKENKEQE